MDFDDYLKNIDSDAGQKEKVALAVYYLEKEQGSDSVETKDVRELVKESRSVISSNSIPVYLGRLEGHWLSKSSDGRYLLSIDGEEGVESLLDGDFLKNPRGDEDQFIDSAIFREQRFEQLVTDINESYRYRIYDGTMVLTRKFFENMVFEILRDEYLGEDVQMFFDQENQRHYSFDELLNNLKIGVPDLKRFTKEGFDREFVEGVRELKDKGNRGAHSVRVDFDDDEMEGYSEDATQYAEVLYEVWRGVTQANESDE